MFVTLYLLHPSRICWVFFFKDLVSDSVFSIRAKLSKKKEEDLYTLCPTQAGASASAPHLCQENSRHRHHTSEIGILLVPRVCRVFKAQSQYSKSMGFDGCAATHILFCTTLILIIYLSLL